MKTRRSSPSPASATRDSAILVLYGRAGCHLCDVLADALRGLGVAFDKVDVDTEPALRARYGARVPVLVGRDGAELCEGAVDAPTLRARLGLE